MNQLDFQSVAIAALASADNLLAEWLPGGKYKGHEFFALNPTRADKSLGSFAVNTHSGAWADYATGDAGGDLVSLYAYLFCNGRQGDALRAVADRLNIGGFEPVQRVEWDGSPKTGGKPKRDKWQPLAPFPAERIQTLGGSRAYGFARNGREEGLRAVYRDADGQPLCVVQRFIDADGGKSDLPFTWCQNTDGVQQWCNRRIGDPQPLFGLDALAAYPDWPVLVVEGEKCKMVAEADAALRGWVVLSWLGGSNGWKKADWAPLRGRDVVLWPDCDSQRRKLSKEEIARGVLPEAAPFLPHIEQPGLKAMLGIAEKLAGIGCRVRLVDVPQPGVWPSGYDIADALQDDVPLCRPSEMLADSALLPFPLPEAAVSPRPSEEECVRENAPTANLGGAGADMLPEADAEELDTAAAVAELLKNYKQIGLKPKAINMQTGETFSRALLEKVHGKSAVSVWLRHEERGTLPEAVADVIAKQRKLAALASYDRFGGMLDRYIYLRGTSDAYDRDLDQIVALSAVKDEFPDQFDGWQKSEMRLTCPMKNYVFEPDLPPGISFQEDNKVNYINKYKGLPYSGAPPKAPYPAGATWQDVAKDFPGCRHIIGLFAHLCTGNGSERANSDVTEFVLNWVACRFREPWKKPATALVFISEVQGVGKSTLGARVLRELFGEYFTALNQNVLESQFNAPLEGKLVTVFEEISPSDERKNVIGKFKDMITADKIMIERKGRDPVEVSDYNSFLVFSNDDRAIPIEPNDRRFMVVEAKKKYTDEQYAALDAEIEAGGLLAFADFLLALPLQYNAAYKTVNNDGKVVQVAERKEFTPHAKPIMTPIKKRMINLNKPAWEAFLSDWWEGELGVPFISAAKQDVWALFKYWVKTTNTFNMQQKNFYSNLEKRLEKKRTWVKIGGESKRPWFFVVPHSWMDAKNQAKYPLPTSGDEFRGGGVGVGAADFYGRQLEDFNLALSSIIPELPKL